MNSPTRHPSVPRKTPPPQSRPLPAVVYLCVRCLDPVVPDVRSRVEPVTALLLFMLGIVPGLLYVLFMSGARAAACSRCGAGELVPLDSARARDALGDEYAATMATARALAGEAARAAEREREAQQRRWLRGIVVVVAVIIGIAAWAGWAFHRQRVHEEETRAIIVERPAKPPEESDTLRQLREIEERRRSWSESDAPAKPAPKLTIAADGVALASPRAGAEPVMRVTAGETYTLGEERDGFVRLADAPVEAWIPKP